MLVVVQEPQANAKLLPLIIDEQGTPVDLAACMAQEQTNLCQVCQALPALQSYKQSYKVV